VSNDDKVSQQTWRSPRTNSWFFKLVESRSDGKIDRWKLCHELWVCKAQLNLFVTPCEINFFQSFLDYTAVSQQQQTAHGAQENCSTVGIEPHLWGNC